MTLSRRAGFASGVFSLLAALLYVGPTSAVVAAPPTTVDLSTYVRVGRFNLPEPTRTTPPANSVLAQEASAVTYDWDTDTLFVVGDGGTSVVQVTKTGQLVNSMTLATGSSPQGTEFYDTEGLTYVGGGKFVFTEERDRRVVQFTYVAGGTLTRAAAQTVTLGTNVGNIGLEGLSWDPQTSGFVVVKETLPQGIFQTGVDFAAGTATNGSATTTNSVDLFNPSLAGVLDFADVFALSNLPSMSGQPQFGNLLVLSQESGKIVNISRTGVISSSLTIVTDPGNPLDVAAQQHEGLTMDRDGNLYVANENGGGDFDHPQLWVYAPSTVPNAAPTALTLINQVNSIVENTSTATRVKVADVVITDDGLGTNNLTVSGADAASFEVDTNGLFIKAGVVLDFETKTSYAVTVNVDEPTLGGAPDASASFALSVTDVVNETPAIPAIIISEVAPWSSGSSGALGVDWFEVTNTSAVAVNITGWKMDDDSNAFGSAVALAGITSIGAGESVIFLETNDLAGKGAAFRSLWFGASPPAGLQVGNYTGSGVGLSTSSDGVSLFDAGGVLKAKVAFGASPAGPAFPTFNNAAGLNNATISTLSAAGVNGAFAAANDANEVGSPGTIGKLFISEVAPWSSGNSPVGADWFEVTNTSAFVVNVTGWKMDDNSGSFAASVPMSGVASIAPGESVIFMEATGGNQVLLASNFKAVWFGDNAPAGLQIGSYTGGGVGLGTGGDAVNLYNSGGALQAAVSFGLSPAGPSFPTFDNGAALNNAAVSQLSAVGVRGAVTAATDPAEIGSPGRIANRPPVANAGPDQSVEATSPAGASVTLNGSGSTDPDANTLTFTWKEGPTTVASGASPSASLSVGAHTLTLTVSDGFGGTSTDTVLINVVVPVDTDRDGLSDPREALLGTNPNTRDTDADGIEDGVEVAIGTNPLSAASPGAVVDTDRDGIPDAFDASPNNADSDADGVKDGWEMARNGNLAGRPSIGDADGSGGAPNAADVTALQNIILGRRAQGNVATFDLDVNRDGVVDTRDSTLLLYRTMGRVPYLPNP